MGDGGIEATVEEPKDTSGESEESKRVDEVTTVAEVVIEREIETIVAEEVQKSFAEVVDASEATEAPMPAIDQPTDGVGEGSDSPMPRPSVPSEESGSSTPDYDSNTQTVLDNIAGQTETVKGAVDGLKMANEALDLAQDALEELSEDEPHSEDRKKETDKRQEEQALVDAMAAQARAQEAAGEPVRSPDPKVDSEGDRSRDVAAATKKPGSTDASPAEEPVLGDVSVVAGLTDQPASEGANPPERESSRMDEPVSTTRESDAVDQVVDLKEPDEIRDRHDPEGDRERDEVRGQEVGYQDPGVSEDIRLHEGVPGMDLGLLDGIPGGEGETPELQGRSDMEGWKDQPDLEAAAAFGSGDARIKGGDWTGSQSWTDTSDSEGNQNISGAERYEDDDHVMTVKTTHSGGKTTQTVTTTNKKTGETTTETSTDEADVATEDEDKKYDPDAVSETIDDTLGGMIDSALPKSSVGGLGAESVMQPAGDEAIVGDDRPPPISKEAAMAGKVDPYAQYTEDPIDLPQITPDVDRVDSDLIDRPEPPGGGGSSGGGSYIPPSAPQVSGASGVSGARGRGSMGEMDYSASMEGAKPGEVRGFINPDGDTAYAMLSNGDIGFTQFSQYVFNKEGMNLEDSAPGTKPILELRMVAADAGLGESGESATGIGTNEAKGTVREEMSALGDELSDWPDDGSTREITYIEVTKNADGTYSYVEKTEVMTKEQAEALLDKMDQMLGTISDGSLVDIQVTQKFFSRLHSGGHMTIGSMTTSVGTTSGAHAQVTGRVPSMGSGLLIDD